MVTHREIIEKTFVFVQQQLLHAEAGHDWFHIERVWNTAKHIAAQETADLLIVELGALLHDIADSKFHNGDETIGPRIAREFLEAQQADEAVITAVENIIRHISFKGSYQDAGYKSIELDIVQDADRLDALGAIGIARAFNYGGFRNRKLYDPAIPPVLYATKEAYKHNEAPTINHFYEKLFLLKDKMNTATGKQMAEDRHRFMEQFVEQFYREWNGTN
ncbi:HD domain-containing protein [Niabella beijingensis]|uniref:HD domain-containing protein n=1 Tax=Niabella beijingensis TaxID=2872700 RepID=UPI001CC14F65|nr:HD domain-containing protein [Niabella beijingensis]MBZ4190702.1 HD domain-containing protein [Niabella beijingensis]